MATKNSGNELLNFDDLRSVFFAALRYWYLVIAAAILAYGLGYLYAHRIEERYEVKSQILLKSEDVYNYQSAMLRGINAYSGYKSYEETANQMRVIRSNTIIERTIDKLDLMVSYYIIGRIKVSEVYEHLPFKVMSPNMNGARSNVLFEMRILDAESFQLTYEIAGERRERSYRFGELITDDGLYFSVETRPSFAEGVESFKRINYAFKINNRQSLVRHYKSAIQTSNLDYTTIVEISLKDNLANRAREFLDTLVSAYLEYTLDNRKLINNNTIHYIDLQIDEVVRKIDEIESELENFKDQNYILDLGKEQELNFELLRSLDAQYKITQLKLAGLKELEEFLLSSKEETVFPPSAYQFTDDAFLTGSLQELFDLKISINENLNTMSPENQKIKQNRQRIENLSQVLLTYVADQTKALKDQEKNQRADIGAVEAKLRKIPENERQVLSISRKLAGYEELYSFLVARRAETEIAKAAIIPETKVIEAAHKTGVIEPDKSAILRMFLVSGIGLAILWILIRVVFFLKIQNAIELRRLTTVPVLGEIMQFKRNPAEGEIIDITGRSRLTDIFRSLRANLEYFAIHDNHKTMLVTSVLPGEGKTFVSANLGTIVSATGKKVLVIDLDLHKPRLHKIFGIQNTIGICNYLAGNASEEDLYHEMSPNLKVITAGPIPPNPSELIFSQKLLDFLQSLREKFDMIIIDTPPVGPVSDALVLMQYIDVKIFVLNSKYLTKRGLSFVENTIRENNIEQATIVLNGVAQRIGGSYYGKYFYQSYYMYGSYSQGYGYNYGYGEEQKK